LTNSTVSRRARAPIALAIALALVVIAAACGSKSNGNVESGGSSATTTATAAATNFKTATGTGSGGTLIIGMTATNIPLLDTGLSQNEGYEGIRFVGNQLYDGLTKFDLKQGTEIPKIIPALAESWEPNADLSSWTFKLRANVKFHDGTPFDADAAIFNLRRYTDKTFDKFYAELSAQAGLAIGGIKAVAKVDAMTIKIDTNGPWSYLPADLATVFFGSPKAITDLGNEGFGQAPVGTGPYKFVSFERGVKLELAKNPDYWGGAPKLDKVILRPIPDPTARVAALRSGEVNWIEVPPPDDAPVLAKEGFQVLTNVYDHVWPWVFDTSKKPFDDVRVRQALNYAIDRDSLVTNILKNTAKPLVQAAPPANFAYRSDADTYTYDPEKAKALLKDAGYPDGFSFSLSFPTSGSGNMVPIPMNEALQQDLAKVGVKVELKSIEWAAMVSDFLSGKIPDGADAINISLSYQQEGFWSTWYNSKSTINVGKYTNSTVDDLFAKAKTVLDDKQRSDIYAQAAKAITTDAPWLFIVNDMNPRAMGQKVKNFTMAQSWFVDLTDIYVES
jgi:peptide/nickel transport system substrate-binding protein